MKFNVTVDRDEDGLWIVECPAIPGCVSQGKTKGEATRLRLMRLSRFRCDRSSHFGLAVTSASHIFSFIRA